MDKIKVKSVAIKKAEANYTLYTVILDEDKPRTIETFNKLEEGKEYEGELTNDPKWGWKFKLPKQKGNWGGGKNSAKQTALECAINAVKITGTEVKTDQIIALAKKFEEYLNG